MGKVSAFFDEQGIPLAGQQKLKMLSLDRQFEQMETEVQALRTENLHLQAQVNPLQRDVDRLQQEIERMNRAAANGAQKRLDEAAEKLLSAIAERGSGGFQRDSAHNITRGSRAEGAYYLGLLVQYHFVRSGLSGTCYVKQAGLAYLKKNGLI